MIARAQQDELEEEGTVVETTLLSSDGIIQTEETMGTLALLNQNTGPEPKPKAQNPKPIAIHDSWKADRKESILKFVS